MEMEMEMAWTRARRTLCRVDAEAQDVTAAALAGLDDEGWPKLGLAHAEQLHLQVGDRDVEVLGEICMPDEAHVGDEEGAQVALIRGQIPNAGNLIVHLLIFVGQPEG